LASSREQAVRTVQNWEAGAGEIYPKVIEMLSKDRSEEEEG